MRISSTDQGTDQKRFEDCEINTAVESKISQNWKSGIPHLPIESHSCKCFFLPFYVHNIYISHLPILLFFHPLHRWAGCPTDDRLPRSIVTMHWTDVLKRKNLSFFLVTCYSLNSLWWSVGWSVNHIWGTESFWWSSLFHYCHRPPARSWGSRVYAHPFENYRVQNHLVTFI